MDDDDDWDEIAPGTPAATTTSPVKGATSIDAHPSPPSDIDEAALGPKVLSDNAFLEDDSDVVLRRTPLIHWYRSSSYRKAKDVACPWEDKDGQAEEPVLLDTLLLSKLVQVKQGFSALEIEHDAALAELKSTQEKLASSREHEQDVYAQTLTLQESLAELKLEYAETAQELQATLNELEELKGVERRLAKYEGLEKEYEELQVEYGGLVERFQTMQDDLKLEADTARKQRDDLERKLSKKEEVLVRTKQEVETLKKVVTLSTNMVAVQEDRVVTANEERDMLFQDKKDKAEKLQAELSESAAELGEAKKREEEKDGLIQEYKEKAEQLNAELAESKKREAETVMAFQFEIKGLTEKLAAVKTSPIPPSPVQTAKIVQIKSIPTLIPTVSFDDAEQPSQRTPRDSSKRVNRQIERTPRVFPFDEDQDQENEPPTPNTLRFTPVKALPFANPNGSEVSPVQTSPDSLHTASPVLADPTVVEAVRNSFARVLPLCMENLVTKEIRHHLVEDTTPRNQTQSAGGATGPTPTRNPLTAVATLVDNSNAQLEPKRSVGEAKSELRTASGEAKSELRATGTCSTTSSGDTPMPKATEFLNKNFFELWFQKQKINKRRQEI